MFFICFDGGGDSVVECDGMLMYYLLQVAGGLGRGV
jgi:hypothetical protein